MNRVKLLKHLLLLMFFILALHYIGVRLYWDYTTQWFDMVLHFLGGFWEGMLFIWFFSIKNLPLVKPSLDINDPKLVFKVIFYVLLIGVLWELFEFYANNYIGIYPFDIIDTSSDIFFDLFGGIVFYFYFLKFIMLDQINKI